MQERTPLLHFCYANAITRNMMVVPAWPFVRKEPRFLMTTLPYLPDAIILLLSPPAFAMDIGLDVYFLFTSYPP